MSDKDLYRLTNPTFVDSVANLFMLYFDGYEEAKALLDELEINPDEILSEEQKQLTYEPANLIIGEARNSRLNDLLKESDEKIVLDIGCGYNPRALLEPLKEKIYIGGDLPVVIRDIKSAYEALLKEQEGVKPRFVELDITNYDTLVETLKNTEGEVILLTDDILLYLMNPELKMALKNIKKLLEERGGYWITGDPEMSKNYMGIMSAMYGEEGLQRMNEMFSHHSEENDVSVGTNAMSIMPWAVEEDTKKVQDYLKDLGFEIEYVNGKSEKDLLSFKNASEAQKEEIEKFLASTCFWKMTPAKEEEEGRLVEEFDGDKFSLSAQEKGGKLIYKLSGRIDSLSAPDFLESYNKIADQLENGSEIVLDTKDLDYISSAGFRVLMIMKKAGHAILIRNANEDIVELFEQMGFDQIVTFE